MTPKPLSDNEFGLLDPTPIGRPQSQSFTRVTLNGAVYQPPNPGAGPP